MRMLRVSAAALIALCTGCAQAPDDAWQDRLEAFIEAELDAKGIPALSIAVVDGSETVFAAGYGNATAETPVSAETVYRVASVSKLFTAMTVMQLVEEGELDLDAPLDDRLEDFRPANPFGVPLTLRQLLSHRSGLVREPPVGHYFDPTEPTLEATVTSLNATSLVYEPEARTKYSNAAVSVAGYVIESTQGRPFAEHAREALIDPLDLAKTDFLPRADLRADLGVGYMWRYDTNAFTEAPVFELGIGPAANLYTTTSDLAEFIAALFDIARGERADILRPESLEEMWTVQYPEPGTTSGFGLGFYVSEFEGERRVQHAGVMYGYATRVYALPESELGVAVVSNLDAINPVVDRIAEHALRLVLAAKAGDPSPDTRATQALDSALARSLAGRYAGPSEIELVERNGLLFLDRGGERHAVRAFGDTLVTDGRLGYGFTLVPGGDTLHTQEGIYLRRPAPMSADIPASWSGLIGEYGWDHNTLYVLERDGCLEVLIEWFFHYPLSEIAPDVFRFPDHGLYMGESLTFTRDERGLALEASLAGVRFKRRAVGPEAGNIFRVPLQKPIEELREEAEAASPPERPAGLRAPDLVDMRTLDATLKVDVRYASTNNFLGARFYRTARVLLQRPAAESVLAAHEALTAQGYGLVLYDGYRPWSVTKIFHDAVPESLRLFVADPAYGSRHNRGCAIDLGLYDLATGEVLEMPSGYDETTPRAFPDYPGGTSATRHRREVLRRAMEDAGFTVYEAEWWHFDHRVWKQYPIMNLPFEDLP